MARTLAIGDIHGCSAALDTLLAAVRPTADDLIITLGDYVHRGPDTPGVLDRLIDLHRTHRVISLRGNHEEIFLEVNRKIKSDVPAAHLHFIENVCRDWYESPTHLFVHGNADPTLPLDHQSIQVLRWEKLYGTLGVKSHKSGKVMVCGHTSQKSGEPLNLGFAVCIDTYCCGGGWLTCLDTASNRIWQADQRGRVREGPLPSVTTLPERKR
jgi:serine/threonine protein phosphatase 1